jgi:hypothetical protein
MNQRDPLPSTRDLALGKGSLCRALDHGHSAKGTLPRARSRTLGKANGCLLSFASDGALPSVCICRVEGTRQNIFCRVLLFAERLTLGKSIVRRVFLFAKRGTRQSSYLPSARQNALSKTIDTRQKSFFR